MWLLISIFEDPVATLNYHAEFHFPSVLRQETYSAISLGLKSVPFQSGKLTPSIYVKQINTWSNIGWQQTTV